MRSIILGAASFVALLAPAAAQADSGGFVDASLGQVSIESEDLSILQLGGTGAAPISQNWNFQGDVAVRRMSEDDYHFTSTDAAAHVYTVHDNFAIGGVLSNRDFYFGSLWSLGLEGQFTNGPLVVEGEVGLGTIEGGSDSESTFNASLNGTFYIAENFSVGLGVDMTDINDFDDEFVTTSLQGEYQLANQFSVFGTYSNTDVSDENFDTFQVGLRMQFGDDTLQGRRANGPRWLPISSGTGFPFFVS